MHTLVVTIAVQKKNLKHIFKFVAFAEARVKMKQKRDESIICAIAATEEEQQRRVSEAQKRHELSIKDKRLGSTPLQKVMELQTEMLQKKIGEELIDFSVQCRKSMTWRRKCCETVMGNLSFLLEKINFQAFIIPYGSYATGFSLPESDLDLVLTSCSNSEDPKNSVESEKCDLNDMLLALSKELKNVSWATNVQYITTAVIPVLKFMASVPRAQNISKSEDEKSFQFQSTLHFKVPQHAGIATVEFVKVISKCIPQIVPVTILLKQCLKQKDLWIRFPVDWLPMVCFCS